MRHDYYELFKKYVKLDLNKVTIVELKKKVKAEDIKVLKSYGKGKLIDLLYEKQVRTSSVQESQVLGHVDPDDRPLYDRSLAQQKFMLQQQLHAMNLELVNEYIYQLRDPRTKGTAKVIESYQELLQKKFYYLNRLGCGDWRNLTDLAIVGIDMENERVNKINELRSRIDDLKLVPKLYRSPTDLELDPDVRGRQFDIYVTPMIPADLTEGGTKKIKYRTLKVVRPTRSEMDLGKYKTEKEDLFRPLEFLPKIRNILARMGQVTYLKELDELQLHRMKSLNGQFAGVDQCNQEGMSDDEAEFKKNFVDSREDHRSITSKHRMQTLKRYIITNLRQRIELLSRLQNVDQMNDHHLFSYVRLIDLADNFSQAFENFRPTLSNQTLEDLVTSNLAHHDRHQDVIRVLEYVFLNDIVQHLRQVRVLAGQHQRGKNRRKGETNLRDVFVTFLKIMGTVINLISKKLRKPLMPLVPN